MSLEVVIIPVLEDNYTYLARDTEAGVTAAVDPAEAGPVLAELEAQKWKLDFILCTHHHSDHIGGNLALQAATGAQIVGGDFDRRRIPGLQIGLRDEQNFAVGAVKVQVLEIFGHTRGHVAFYFSSGDLFCGDTLFGMGCGRLFEGSAEEMWASLQRIAALPESTRVWCGHEYTESNGAFAHDLDPSNSDITARLIEVRRLRAEGKPTVPFTLGEELRTNPFLRLKSAGELAKLRELKNRS